MIPEISERIFGNRILVLLIAFANLAGFFVGISYYREQLMDSSPLLWVLILDSPVSVLLFAVVCLLIYFRKKVPDLLKFLASAYVIKYGLWTAIVLLLYWGTYVLFEDQVITGLNFILHSGMVLEGILLVPKIKPDKYNTVIVLAILLLNDFFDYFLGTVTRIPETYMNFLMLESFIATILVTLLMVIAMRDTKSG